MAKSGTTESSFDVSSRVDGMRILIIDDDPAKLDALASMLRSMGASVSVGGRGKSGYAQASLVTPDVIISGLISPGEDGWKLVQDVRRHPVLRWTPFLLINWWQEGADGHGTVLKDRLLERLEEVLTPSYVIKDRIRTDRPLGGHVSSIGPVALLRLLVQGGLTGTLTVNDGWSVFETKIKKNALHSVRREGVAGFHNEGVEAFVQLLLSDSGRWFFRADKGTLQPSNIEPDVEKALSKGSSLLADLFKRGLSSDPTLVPIRARLGVVDSAESALSVTAQRVTEAFENRSEPQELDDLIRDIDNPMEFEMALRMLVRVGVIIPFEDSEDRDGAHVTPEERAASNCASYLFAALAPVFRDSARPASVLSGVPDEDRDTVSEFEEVEHNYGMPETTTDYDVSAPPLPPEASPAEVETMLLEGMDTPSIMAEREHRAVRGEGGFKLKPRIDAISRSISIVISTAITKLQEFPRKRLKNNPFSKIKTVTLQMWVAIAITVIFGALVVTGLFLIGDETSSETTESSGE